MGEEQGWEGARYDGGAGALTGHVMEGARRLAAGIAATAERVAFCF